MARALDDLPAITEAFAKGEVSYSQVRGLTRVAEPSTESDLLMIARHATAAQLERLVRLQPHHRGQPTAWCAGAHRQVGQALGEAPGRCDTGEGRMNEHVDVPLDIVAELRSGCRGGQPVRD